MFEFEIAGVEPDAAAMLDAGGVRTWIEQLARTDTVTDDAARIDLIGELETLTRAAAAAQAALSVAFDASQRQQQADAGIRPQRRHRGIAEQVALARKESPHRGRQHLGLAKVLVAEMPHTWAAFRAGRITEFRATVLVRETACLSLEDRQTVDRAVAGDADALEGYSDRVVEAEVKKLAARLDAVSVAKRRRRAESERRVTVRPAPDVMTYVTALLPVAQGVAVYAALKAEADRLVASGDPRSRGQIMADTLVCRVTGAPCVGGRPVVPVTIDLVMTDRALFSGAADSAHIAGFGVVPAESARGLVADMLDAGSVTWLRRLYTSPTTDELVAMDARTRRFSGELGHFLDLRDQFCRTPWCDAPIRHRDHVIAVADGGATSAVGGQGLCEGCNHAKQAPGWRARPGPGPDHVVVTRTPTGHTYRSTAPPAVAPRRAGYVEHRPGLWTRVA